MSYEQDVNFYALDLFHASESGDDAARADAYIRLLNSDVAISDVIKRVVDITQLLVALTPQNLQESWRATVEQKWLLARQDFLDDLPATDDTGGQ